jgi:uncharacterized protein (TIGR02145 family)
MRKLILTTAAIAAAIAGAFADETAFGTFTDTRDGQTYKTVKIGKQTWMAQNLNYKTKGGSWCYNDSASYCKQYGRLYDWKTATTVCPKGWKLPSREDWDYLVATADDRLMTGKKLKVKKGWNNDGNGTNDFGFSALPGGGCCTSDGFFKYAGDVGYWWSNDYYKDDDYLIHTLSIHYRYDYVDEGYYDKSNGFSVRCVADNP